MADFIEEGKKNPAIVPTQEGFTNHICRWIVAAHLPFTIAESEEFKAIFEYLKIPFKLPTDTTVSKKLHKMHTELKDTVVRELSVIDHSTRFW